MARRSWLLLVWLGLGYAFLYISILLLILFSFNESRLVTVWSGFSTKWYGELAHNGRVLDALKLSLAIAVFAATGAVIIGTMTAYALTRFGRFRGRGLLSGLVSAPYSHAKCEVRFSGSTSVPLAYRSRVALMPPPPDESGIE